MDRDKLIIDNIPLIYFVLKRLNVYKDKNDYYSIGMIGLVKGAKLYDPDTGIKPSTYLYKCIYNEIINYIRRKSRDKRIPQENFVSLSVPIADNIELEDLIADDIDIEQDMIDDERNKRIYEEIAKLNYKEQVVIKSTFQLDGFTEMTQTELAKMLNVSQCQISRIRKKALIKLKVRLKDIKNYPSIR